MWDFRFSRLRVRRLEPSGIQSHVVSEYTDVSSPWWLILYAPLKRRSTPRLRRYSQKALIFKYPLVCPYPFGVLSVYSFDTASAHSIKSLLHLGSCERTTLFVPTSEWAGGQSGGQKPPSRPMTPPVFFLVPLTRRLGPKAEGIVDPTVGFVGGRMLQTCVTRNR
jgi:hypothetical protein